MDLIWEHFLHCSENVSLQEVANSETCCDVQETQSHTLYCFLWERGYVTSFCSEKQKHLGVLIIDNSLLSVVSGLPLRPCNLESCLDLA